MIKLVDATDEVQKTPRATEFLYELLKERDETINISHRKMPSFEEHIAFVESRPYREWFLIYDEWGNVEMGPIGAIYLSKKNEIGIFIAKEYQGKGHGKTAICLLMNRHPGECFLANINPLNKRSIDVFLDLGFELIQLTYAKRLEMNQRTVTLIVPDGYESGEEFAKDCGFEIWKPPALPWNAYSNRNYEPVEKRAAEIYNEFEYDGPGEKPAWTPHGNGTKQDEARQLARLELAGFVNGS